MSIDKSTKSSSNSNPSMRIENKAGGNENREAPLMIASGNVYLRLGFLFMLGLLGFLIWSHIELMQVMQSQTRAIISVSYTVGQHENLIKQLEITNAKDCKS